MKQFWAKTQSSYVVEESELLIPDDEFNFLLFLKINIEMLNELTEFKEKKFSDKKLPSSSDLKPNLCVTDCQK